MSIAESESGNTYQYPDDPRPPLRYGDPINPKRRGALFIPIPDWLAERPEIAWGAKAIYGRLARYFNEREGYAYPKVDILAATVGMSERQTFRHLQELESYGLIRRIRRGLGLSNAYGILFHPWMDDRIDRPPGQDSADQDLPHTSRPDLPYVAVPDLPYVADPSLKRELEETTRRDNIITDDDEDDRSATKRGEAMGEAFRILWREHAGDRAAKALSPLQIREAVALWDKAIEIGHGELLEESVRLAARNADASRWQYFVRVLENKIADAGGRLAPVVARWLRSEDSARHRRVLERHRAGEEINPLALAAALEWEREQNGEAADD